MMSLFLSTFKYQILSILPMNRVSNPDFLNPLDLESPEITPAIELKNGFSLILFHKMCSTQLQVTFVQKKRNI